MRQFPMLPRAFLPNINGYKFLGFFANGDDIEENEAEIVIKDGRFTVENFENLTGWRPIASMCEVPQEFTFRLACGMAHIRLPRVITDVDKKRLIALIEIACSHDEEG